MNICSKCNKVVPDNEVVQYTIFGKTGKKLHRYTRMVNAYRNQRPGVVGFCPVSETVHCGEIQPPINYCPDCKKAVPDSEVRYCEPNSFHNGFYYHFYESYENIAPPSDGMNCCLANVPVWCGQVREPTLEEFNQMKKSKKEPETTEENEMDAPPAVAKGKPYTEEAHEFLKVLGKWVELKKTFPSGYVDYHEATRKFLENFKNKK